MNVNPARLERVSAGRGLHYAQAYRQLHPDSNAQALPIAADPLKGYAIFVAPGLPIYRASGLGMNGPVTADDLRWVEDFFVRHGVSPRVDLCPLAHPTLLPLLRQRGYRPDQFFNVYYRALPVPDIPIAPPAGIEIRLARPTEADLWIQTLALGFSQGQPPAPADYDILGPNFHAQQGYPFFAFVEGQPAGGGGMYAFENAVELGGASTLPAFRRRGIQIALLHARLRHAARLGCDLAVVTTTPGSNSQRNIERAGFKLAYTRLTLIR